MTAALAGNLRTRAITLGGTILGSYAQWYEDGAFYNAFGNQWVYTTGGPIGLAANMYRATRDKKYLEITLESCDYAVDQLQHPTGGYFIDVQPPTTASTALEIYVFILTIGWVLFVLEDAIDHDHAAHYMRCMRKNVEHIVTTADIIWFENGNWVANKVRMLHLLREVSRRLRNETDYAYYDALYTSAYALMITPVLTDSRWTGYGLITDVAGTWSDWSDTQAHITELASGPPMPNAGAGTSSDGIAPFSTYDGDYTALTLDHLAGWYVASLDFRARKLLNGVTNKYMATVNTTTWLGNFTHGSRHNNPNNSIYTPALAVLAMLGERQSGTTNFTDTIVLDQWDRPIISIFTSFPNGDVAFGVARSFMNTVGTILYACEVATPRL